MNTIFQVAHNAGMRTAWADKHAAYELISGHSGRAIDDLFTPEINSSTTDPSLSAGPGPDWTTNNRDTQFYDAIKVRAILNEIDGRDHSGRAHPGAARHLRHELPVGLDRREAAHLADQRRRAHRRLPAPRRPLGAGAGAAGRARLRRPPARG